MLVRSYSEKEAQLVKRTGKPSQKDVLFEKIQEIFQKSTSLSHFEKLLAKSGIKTYCRSGRLTGVYYGKRRYRFKQSLGIDLAPLQIMKRVSQRIKGLRKLRDSKSKDKGFGLGY